MTATPPELQAARERFLSLVEALRPDLHRYCSRLVGSAIDGEDVVQDALAKAYYALSLSPELPPLKPWLLRIAHNTAIDSLRRYERRFVEPVAEVPEGNATPEEVDPDTVRAALSSFVALPVLQRSCVILKDVLGWSLEDIADANATTVMAVKAALVRGRGALRAQKGEQASRPESVETPAADRAVLERYASLFNARDWDGLEAMLVDETRLDLVSKSARRGRRQIAPYLSNYAKETSRVEVGKAEGRDVLYVFRPAESERPAYIIVLETDGDRLARIRDYRYVPYLIAALVPE